MADGHTDTGTEPAPALTAPDSTATSPDSIRRYSVTIDTPKAHVSGIMILREDGHNVTGSMINEFGVSAMDFIFSKTSGGITLVNVARFLDKWYIRKTLEADIAYCMHVLYGLDPRPRKHISVTPGQTTTTVTNRRRNLIYSFTPFTAISAAHTDSHDTRE